MSSRSLVLALVLAAPVPLAMGQTMPPKAPAPAVSALKVDKPSLDLGRVASGETVLGTFVLHNTGDKVIKIIRAKPS